MWNTPNLIFFSFIRGSNVKNRFLEIYKRISEKLPPREFPPIKLPPGEFPQENSHSEHSHLQYLFFDYGHRYH